MKRQHTHLPVLNTALAAAALIALAATPLAAYAGPQPAMESNGVYVTILSPNPGTQFSGDGKQIEVSAFYQAPLATGGVSVLELYIDGTKQADKKLDAPETRGVVSFLISPDTLTPGPHQIVVRVSAMDAEIASAKTSLRLKGETVDAQGEAIPLTAPHVFIASPAPETTVSGTVAIKVNANDDSGKPPYVSLFVDHAFKTLRNFPPFDFEWDTTHVSNGYHTIEVWGYNDAQMVGHAEPLRVLVNNPGGRTQVRHDLSDVVTPATTHSAVRPSIVKSSAPKTAPKPMLVKLPTLTPHRASLAAPILAAGRTAHVPATPQRLAEARPSTSGLDEATALMVPFLRPDAHASPAAKPAPMAVAPTVKASPIAAKPVAAAKPIAIVMPTTRRINAPRLSAASAAATAPIQLADSDAGSDSDFSTETELAAPFLQQATPIHHSAPAPVQAAPVKTVPARTEMVAPKMAPALSVQAPSTLSATRIASASVSSSDLFTGGSTLQTPSLTAMHPIAVPVTHRLATAATVAASSVRAMLRARGSMQVVLNDRIVSLDKPLAERGSILFAPFRQIFESSGGSLDWLSGTRTVHAVSPTKDIQITIGSRDVLINNQLERLTISPYLQTGRTMVPLSFLPLALDVTVNFDPITGHVVIDSKD